MINKEILDSIDLTELSTFINDEEVKEVLKEFADKITVRTLPISKSCNLEEIVTILYNTPSDINEHFPAMIQYGSECETITEMGVRGICSTWAWLATGPKKLISYDMNHPSKWGGDIQSVYDTAAAYGLNFEFKLADVLKIEIDETDLLFIDTWHTYDQLKKELELHSNKVKKYICFHDTTSYEFKDEISAHENTWVGETSGKGIWPAIEEFLELNKDKWIIEERFMNNNGFTVIKRL